MALKFVNPESFIKGYESSRYRNYEYNDCVVKAFAVLFGVSYDEAHGFTRGFFSRGERTGTYGFNRGIQSMMRHPTVRFYGNLKAARRLRGDTIIAIQKRYPHGIFLVDSYDHVSVLCDGVWVDYEGIISADTKVHAIYQFTDFTHYEELRAKVHQTNNNEFDWLSVVLFLFLISFLILNREMVKHDLIRLGLWIKEFIL